MNDETLGEQLDAIDFAITTHILKNQPNYPSTVARMRIKLKDKAKQTIIQLILQDRERAVREARIDELNRLIKLHTRTYTQTITDNMGEVYLSDGHSYISKYEAQERLAQLSNPTQEKK